MSKISIEGNASGTGTLTIAAPNTNTNYSLSLPEEAGTITTSNSPYSTFRNRIINGDMRIDQRNAGASVSTSNGAYYLDRWLSLNNGTGFTSTAQQSTTVPANFTNSFVLTTSTTKTPASGEGFVITQKIEGYNTADFGFGTANAKTITLSFYVRSSKTGTYSVCFVNSAFDRSYVAEYTIASANTWEQKSITLTGDTSGTWNTTTSMGVGVYFSVSNGDGNNTTSTTGSWQAGNFYLGSQNQVNLFDASSATFYITGVQLEVGSVATPFERRPFGTELQLCQRYYEQVGGETYSTFGVGFNFSTTGTHDLYYYKVTKRVLPTLTTTGTAADYQILHNTATNCSAVPTISTVNSSTQHAFLTGTVASGLTTGQGSMLRANNSSSVYLGFNSEL
jgi:hypothetical protein